MHYVRVTLVTGQQLTITVEIPPGTPVDQLQIPGLPARDRLDRRPRLDGDHAHADRDAGADGHRPRPRRPPRRRRRPRTRTAARQDQGQEQGQGRRSSQDEDAERDRPRSDQQGVRRRANTESLTGKVEEAADADARGATTTRPTSRPTRPRANDPSYTLAEPGAAKIGVPNFFIDKFRIPPFLLPIYQAAGTQYGIRWELLAAINEIETDYGRNLNVSSAGAQGWMQFMPASWKAYGVDGNNDGLMDPYNPVDAIFAAARYLKAAGADKDIRGASSPTTTPTGTSTRCCCAPRSSAACRPTSSARSPA